MVNELLALFQNDIFLKALDIVFSLWPIWLPVILVNIAFHHWVEYIQRDWVKNQGSVLLEIRLPREVLKTPAAMESVFEGLWDSSSAGSLADAFWVGKQRDWFSFEIVSMGGQVRFFIWAIPRWKKVIEARIYAQYPGAEVMEVKDYALDLHFDPEKHDMYGITTKLNKADAFPIKTYVDYQLEKVKSKEQEEAIDPLTPLIEYMGTLKPGEFMGFQILIQAHKKEGLLDGRLIAKKDWTPGIKEAIKNILEKEALIKPEKEKPASFGNLTESQKDAIKSIERNAAKLPFDTMIRILYMAPKDIFQSRGAAIVGSMRQFGTHHLNGIKPDGTMSAGSPWQDLKGILKRSKQRTHVDAYKRRSFFHPPYKHLNGKPFVLTTEELATLYHIPGAMVSTPTLVRTPSKKSEAPANLPV
jgi:hypothetical protein